MRTLEQQKTSIPDIELARSDGVPVNPSHFIGHDLIVLFLPGNEKDSVRDLAEYDALADRLARDDAYMIVICEVATNSTHSRVANVSDPESKAWKEFDTTDQAPRRAEGAVYLFGRGGCLRRRWEGPGHAQDVFTALEERG